MRGISYYFLTEIGMKSLKNLNTSVISQLKPWWQEPYVWLVISGPLSAIVACVVTAFYIMQGPDAVMPESAYPRAQDISNQVSGALPAMQPAQSGRNHSATGGKKNERH
jgi:uncharacterized protein